MLHRFVPTVQRQAMAAPAPSREREAAPAARPAIGNQTVLRTLQRKCSCGGTCPDCQKDKEVQRSAAGPAAFQAAPPLVHQVLRSSGQAMDAGTRTFMEARFGRSFSSVRVHTEPEAAASARAVNAHAYTVGDRIVFADGQYAPDTVRGRHTLAHELTHVIQQSGASSSSLDKLGISDPGDSYEREAERTADQVMNGSGPPAVSGTGAPALQRQQATCSIDFIEAAKLLKGDRGAALKVLNCCQSGLGPLPSGCTKDLVEAAEKILGKKKGGGKTTACPPGFHASRTKDYAGLCCLDAESTESQSSCCPPERIKSNAVAGATCCPEGTVADAAKKSCVSPPPPSTDPVAVCPEDKPASLLSCICPPERQNKDAGLCCPVGQQAVDGQCATPPAPVPAKPSVVTPAAPIEIYFNHDRPRTGETGPSGSLNSKGTANLATLKDLLTKNPDWKVQLIGKASPPGTEEYNQALGARRARLIAKALVDAGIDRSRIADSPLGSACDSLGDGLFSCGETGATGAADRQVRAEIYTSK